MNLEVIGVCPRCHGYLLNIMRHHCPAERQDWEYGGLNLIEARQYQQTVDVIQSTILDSIRLNPGKGKEVYMTDDQIERTFTYQAPFGTQVERYKSIRDKAKEFAYLIQAHCPESREKSLALTHLQTVVMFANTAIAINEQAV